MNRLSAFFKGRDTHLGLFYPEHYLLAVLGSVAVAIGICRMARICA
jgi:hypothetical protein